MSGTNRWITKTLLLVLGMSVAGRAQDVAPDEKTPDEEPVNKASAPKKSRPARRGIGPAQILVQRFDREAPQIGDAVPDVTAYDSKGNDFNLRSLKENYSVLVFGCLT